MYKDEIIEEVWRNRDAYAKKHHYNINEIVADLQKREKEHPAKIIYPQTHNVAMVAEEIPTLEDDT